MTLYCDMCHQIRSLLLLLQVEAALATSNFADNIMVYADPFHTFCVALVVPSRHALEGWANESGIKYNDFSDLCGKPEAKNAVQQSLLKVWKRKISFHFLQG